jgi:TPR repeat protein
MSIRSIVAGLGTVTLIACFHGTKPVEAPEAAKLVFDTDPQAVRVQMVKQPSAPLTVDWSMQDRKALEARVHQRGAIVVRFDDRTLEPLPDCRPQGSYVFTGVTHGRELIGARTTAELAANFPLTAVRLGGHYAEAEQLSADLHVVGMANLDRPVISRAEVESPVCRGATHIVTEITHGGFRFGGSRTLDADAHASVPALGSGSAGMNASAGRLSEDGEVAACQRATWKDTEPPAQCGGVIRIRLVPIEAKETKETVSCPPGLRWTGSGCASEQLAQKQAGPVDAAKISTLTEPRPTTASFACDPSRPTECYTQCLAGNADSCSSLGLAFVLGAPGIEKNVALGQRLFQIACNGGSSDGCFQAGSLAMEQKRFQDGLAASARACEMGNPNGCTNEAYAIWRGLGGIRRDPQRAFELFARACNRRDFVSCNNAGVMMFFDTTGTLKRNPPFACKMFGQACESGQTVSCANVGICLEHGIDRPKDLDQAFKYYATACDAGAGFGCVWGGLLLEEGRRGDPAAVKIALQQYEQTCQRKMEGLNSCVSTADIRAALPGRYSDDMVDRHACDGGSTEGLACYNAALIHERGLVGPPNSARAAQLLKRACTEFELKKACRPAR